MNTILYLKDIPVFKKILGFAITFLGILVFFMNIIFGLIFLVIGINILMTEGSEINLQNKHYRSLKSLFGIHFGKWKPTPEFEYVSVFKTKENQTIRVITAETTLQNDVIVLNLFYNRNKHITIYKTQDKNDAFRVAEKLSAYFNIEILDATTSEKKWL